MFKIRLKFTSKSSYKLPLCWFESLNSFLAGRQEGKGICLPTNNESDKSSELSFCRKFKIC